MCSLGSSATQSSVLLIGKLYLFTKTISGICGGANCEDKIDKLIQVNTSSGAKRIDGTDDAYPGFPILF